MKFFIVIALFFSAITTSGNQNEEKAILGEWCSPYSLYNEGIVKGFHLMKGGKCKAMNVPALELSNWEMIDGYLITKGFFIDEKGVKEEYYNKEKIDKLSKDSMVLISEDQMGKFRFVYYRPAFAKKKYAAKLAALNNKKQ